MANAIRNFWDSALGKLVLTLLSTAIIVSAGTNITSLVWQGMMDERVENHITENDKDFDTVTAELKDIKAELKDINRVVERSATSIQMHMNQKDAHK